VTDKQTGTLAKEKYTKFLLSFTQAFNFILHAFLHPKESRALNFILYAWSMKLRALDQGKDQKGSEERLSERTGKHVN